MATEGAKRCITYGFSELGIKKIVAVAPKINEPSIHVMKKIGMRMVYEFEHPNIATLSNLLQQTFLVIFLIGVRVKSG